jgi:hypothetical protein
MSHPEGELVAVWYTQIERSGVTVPRFCRAKVFGSYFSLQYSYATFVHSASSRIETSGNTGRLQSVARIQAESPIQQGSVHTNGAVSNRSQANGKLHSSA